MTEPPAIVSGHTPANPSLSSGPSSEPSAAHVDYNAVPAYNQGHQPASDQYQGQYPGNHAQTSVPAPANYPYPQYPQGGFPTTTHQVADAATHAASHQSQPYWYPPPPQDPYAAYHQPYSQAYYPPAQPSPSYPPAQQSPYYPPSQQSPYYPPPQPSLHYPPAQPSQYYWPPVSDAPPFHHQGATTTSSQYPDYNAYWSQGTYSQTAPPPSQQQSALSTPALVNPTAPPETAAMPTIGKHPRAELENNEYTKKRKLEVPDAMKQEEATDPGIVFVWDLDETLIIFQSLLTGKYADLEGLDEKRRAEALKLGEQWEKLILDISDTAMLFEQVEEFDQPSIGHVAENDDGASLDDFDFGELNLKKPLTDAGKQKLAYLYRHIQALYAKGATHLLTGDKRGEWQGLYAATDRFTKGWLFAGRRLLAECATARLNSSGQTDPNRTAGPGSDSAGEGGLPPLGKRTVVLVSSGQLIPTLTKCLLFRLDPWIDPANVYSSKVVGKLQCFKWIRERFGGGNAETRFCAVGDGVEEQAAARMMSWPFLRVASGLDPDMSLPKIRLEQLTDLLADVKSKT